MTEIKDQVLAFIGPDESCASEALVAAAWNIPLISYKCIDQKLSNKTIYPTFARTLPPSSKISKSIISLLKYFNWNTIVLIVSGNPTNKQVQESLIKLANEHHIQINLKYHLPDHYLSRYQQILEKIIDDSNERTRSKKNQ
ncbi:atrial natriuretic peptide receptor-like protein 1 [Sarcoptes scabiei]|uniref:Atrial natriuretic peptide receptor-like protein 1 n=1 Tax=Sarcoptes scabiei TaxID=52283 RepID=A0A132AME7_SARSC|nr:atrial natriuretic peptide receptor-like protein 1 [Sarcoptes scabiei]